MRSLDWESEEILESEERRAKTNKYEERSEKRNSDNHKDRKRSKGANIFTGTTLGVFLR